MVADLPLRHPDFGKAQPCPKCLAPTLKAKRLAKDYGKFGISGILTGMTFHAFTMRSAEEMGHGQRASLELALLEAQTFAAAPRGFLFLTGSPGCGKTHLAVAITQAALDRGVPALFVVAPDLLDHLRAAYDDESVRFDDRWEAVRTVDLLALDDFGAQSDTAWAREKLYQLVNYRVNHDLPTVVTSNWTEREFSQYHGRIASRLKAAVHVHISAPDARGKIARGA